MDNIPDALAVLPHIEKSLALHEISTRDIASFYLVENVIGKIVMSMPGGVPLPTPEEGLPDTESFQQRINALRTDTYEAQGIGKIGIIGAGAAGLYAAMILQDLGIPYEILEANERIGGRLFTHRFNGEVGKKAPVHDPARYDYFDVGAMRFPYIVFMDRVFNLFKRIEIEDLLTEYSYTDPENLMYFNNIGPLKSRFVAEKEGDHFHVAESNNGSVPDKYATKGTKHWLDQIYDPYKDEFKKIEDKKTPKERLAAFDAAWKLLTAQDHFSTRGYMLAGPAGKPKCSPGPFPQPVTDWLETFDAGTGWYDGAFVEAVMHSLDFGWDTPHTRTQRIPPHPNRQIEEIPPSSTGWYCLDGGSDRIIEGMLKKLNNQPIIKQRVTKIVEGDGKMVVTCANQQTYQYDQVINTAPLGCIGTMDLEGCNLLYNQKTAIRCLQYSASTKVGLKFERRWWEDDDFMKKNQRVGGHSITGGQSATDLPIRCCVYPSYGRGLQQPAPGILLACYNWGQDASRIGALVGTNDEELLDVVLNDISKLHNIPREKIPPVLNHFAHSWSSDQYTRGAFAMFGPGQFGNASAKAPIAQASSFVSLKAPAAKGKLHFAGEATSVHHAWVQGALNSAWRAVYNALEGHPEKQDDLINRWGIPDEESPTHLKILSFLAQKGKL